MKQISDLFRCFPGDPQTVHSGVHGNMDVNGSFTGVFFQHAAMLLVNDRLGQVVVPDLSGQHRRCVAKDQDLTGNACAPKLHPFCQGGYAKMAHTGAAQDAAHRDGAMAIGIGLDHGHDPVATFGTEKTGIMDERVCGYFGPGPGC